MGSMRRVNVEWHDVELNERERERERETDR